MVNLQGDLPTVDPTLLKAVLRPLDELDADITTLAVTTNDPAGYDDPNVVKAIIAFCPSDPQNGESAAADLGRTL